MESLAKAKFLLQGDISNIDECKLLNCTGSGKEILANLSKIKEVEEKLLLTRDGEETKYIDIRKYY